MDYNFIYPTNGMVIGAMKSNEYLDAVKTAHDIKSESALAVFLGVKKQQIHQIRNFKAGVRADMILSVAKALDLPVTRVAFDMLAETCRTPEAKKEFLNLSKTASVAILASSLFLGTATFSSDSKAYDSLPSSNTPTLYIMLSL